jgi:hypothetical protein
LFEKVQVIFPMIQHEEELAKSQIYEELQVFGTDRAGAMAVAHDYGNVNSNNWQMM